jgi:hypothetical protein
MVRNCNARAAGGGERGRLQASNGEALPNEGGEAGNGGALQCMGHWRAGKWASGLMHCNAVAWLQAVKRMTSGEALQCEGGEAGVNKGVWGKQW